MRLHAFASAFLVVMVVLTASGGVEAYASDCDRAASIRKDVRGSNAMPSEIKAELLYKASRLCPEKGDPVSALKKADALYSQRKFSEALAQYQKAVEFGTASTCPKVLKATRDLTKRNRPALAGLLRDRTELLPRQKGAEGVPKSCQGNSVLY